MIKMLSINQKGILKFILALLVLILLFNFVTSEDNLTDNSSIVNESNLNQNISENFTLIDIDMNVSLNNTNETKLNETIIDNISNITENINNQTKNLTKTLLNIFNFLTSSVVEGPNYIFTTFYQSSRGTNAESANFIAETSLVANTGTRNSEGDSFTANIGSFSGTSPHESLQINSYLITPKSASNNSLIQFYISAINFDSIWVNIDIPGNSQKTISLKNNDVVFYLAKNVGIHNITFYANDTQGHISSIFDNFEINSINSNSTNQSNNSGSSSSSGSSGGGSSASENGKIEVIPDKIVLSMKQGDIVDYNLTLINNGTSNVKIKISSEGITDLLRIQNNNLEIAPGENKIITIEFIAKEQTTPGLYVGKLNFDYGNSNKEVLVSLNVNPYNALFDVNLEVPKQYKTISAGSDLVVNNKIFNLGKIGRVDVKLLYEIRNENNELILSNEEYVAVETQFGSIKTIHIPSNIPDGKYVVNLIVSYNGNIASASDIFNISEGNKSKNKLIYTVLSLFVIFALGFVLWKASPSILNYIKNIRLLKNKSNNSLKNLIDKKVINESGDFIGNVKEVIIQDNKIFGLQLKLNKKFSKRKVLVKFDAVNVVGELVVVKDSLTHNL